MKPHKGYKGMKINPRDRARYRKCLSCDNLVLPPRRKCNECKKSKKYTVTELRPSRRGMNKTGIAAHKPDKSHTRKAKRQHAHRLGEQPNDLQAINMRRWV